MKLGVENVSPTDNSLVLVMTCECGAETRRRFDSLSEGEVITCVCGKAGQIDDLSGIRAALEHQATIAERFGKMFKG